mgnify:CR=1 FL=1
MRAYFEVAKITIRNSLVYRLNTIVGLLTSFFFLTIQIFLWKSLLSYTKIENVSIEEMTAYLTMGMICSTLYNSNTTSYVGNKVNDGSIAMELIKPYSFTISVLFQSLGVIFSNFLVRGLPLLIIVPFLFDYKLDLSMARFFILIAVLLMNILIYWMIFYIIGLMYFVLTNATWFVRLTSETIALFGGSLIPLWFFPDLIKNISWFLPFQLLFQFPQSLIINKISNFEIVRNFVLEFIWIVILIGIVRFFWVIGKRKVVIQGG